MKALLLSIMIVVFNLSLNAQSYKPIIDTGMLFTWPYFSPADKPAISADGKYVAYIISNQPLKSKTLVVQSSAGSIKREFISKSIASEYFFSQDGKRLFWTSADTLFFFGVDEDKLDYISSIGSFQLPVYKKGEWISYQLKNDSSLFLYNMCSDRKLQFENVSNYIFSNIGNSLVLTKEGANNKASLEWINLPQGNSKLIWKGTPNQVPGGYVFNAESNQLAFTVQLNDESSIWCYKAGMEKAIEKVNKTTRGIPKGVLIKADAPQFSANAKWLFFKMKQSEPDLTAESRLTQVTIWSYNDLVIPAQLPSQKEFTGVISLLDSIARVIETNSEKMSTPTHLITGDYVVVRDNIFTPWWHNSAKSNYCLLSLKNGKRTIIKEKNNFPLINFGFSSEGKYLIYWDCEAKAFMTYETRSGKLRNITKGLPPVSIENETSIYSGPECNIIGWYQMDTALLIYDRFDIWKVDPSGERASINITNDYGARHHVKLRLAYDPGNATADGHIFNGNEELLLTGFNTTNKYNGFYRKKLNQKGDPVELVMGPHTYYRVHSQKGHGYAFSDGMQPVQAIDANAYIIRRESAAEYPNYYYTQDFKRYIPLTNFQPQKQYNWLTSELITYKQIDGTISHGVLYKPENFDPKKKYPVLFNYYEKLSHRLYEFPYPGLTSDNIDIPWFVSRGYLVFTPDIYYSVAANKGGKTTGEAAYNSIVGAALHLAKLPYVDGKKMGLQGHSFGGGETNYLVANSNIFAAAASAACTVSDEISAYLGVRYRNRKPIGDFRLSHVETGHDMIGATLWERPDLFIKASPVFKANQVTTPLLLMHNQGDVTTDWGQSIELFMALRRLSKPTWFLQYENSDHSLVKKDAKDYTIRITQFFDHLLKGQAAPNWMTHEAAAYLNEKEAFELDPSGSCGDNCKVCRYWNQKFRKDSTATMKEMDGK